MMPIGIVVLIGLVAALSVPVRAAAVQSLTVDQTGPYYRVVARIHLRAEPSAAFDAATEFEQVAARSPMIESTRRIDDNELVSRMRLCVVWYCKTVRQVMRYRLDRPKRLLMQVVPGRGDLKAGIARWCFLGDGADQTTLVFTARLIPDFWVPPLIGSWAISRALRRQIKASAAAIEQIARAATSAAAGPDQSS